MYSDKDAPPAARKLSAFIKYSTKEEEAYAYMSGWDGVV